MVVGGESGHDIYKKQLPVGVGNFENLIKNDFYYVDKTGLIEDLMQNWGR